MLIVIGILVAFVLLLVFARPGVRSCRWRADRRRDEGGRSYFRCAACGAEEYCAEARAPRHCHRTPIE